MHSTRNIRILPWTYDYYRMVILFYIFAGEKIFYIRNIRLLPNRMYILGMRISNFKNSYLVLDSMYNFIDSIWISNQGEWRNYLIYMVIFITSKFEDDKLFPYVHFYVWVINIIINIYLVWWLPVTILMVLGILLYMFIDFVYL